MDIGTTRAGTVIPYKANQSLEEFADDFLKLSEQDQFDCYCMMQWLYSRARQKYAKESQDYRLWVERLDKAEKLIAPATLEAQKSALKKVTSHELVQFGRDMCANFWRII